MKKIISILLLIILISCNEKEITINLDKHENKLVVNSLLAPSDSVKVNISKSISVLENDTVNYIENAEVQFYCQNKLVNTMNYLGSGMYYLNTSITTGNEYSIIVDVSDFETITANSVIPGPSQILSVDTISIDDEYLYCEIELRNDLTSLNYYLLEVESKYPLLNSDSTLTNQVDIINSELIIENGDLGEELERLVFTGEVLQDSVYALGFILDKETLKSGAHSSNTLYIHFKKISEEYYLYVKSYYASESKQDEVYSNVENGYGIFAGYCLNTDSLVINNP